MNKWRFGALLLIMIAAGWTLGELGARAIKPKADPVVAVGDSIWFHDEVVYDSVGQAVRLGDLLSSIKTVLIVFRPGCTSCIAESAIWNELAAGNPDHRVLVLADTPDRAYAAAFGRTTRAEFHVLRCDDSILRAIRPPALPLVLVISNGAVEFLASGPGSTDDVKRWLAGV